MTVRPLNPELQALAKTKINEDPNRIESDLAHIKEWLKKQPHLKVRTDDQWLIAFLRGCKYSLERTKEKLDTFYTLKSMLPQFFDGLDPTNPKLRAIIKSGMCLLLPLAAPDAPRVLYFRQSHFDPSKTDIVDVMKVQMMILYYILVNDDNLNVAGMHMVQNLEGSTMAHFTAWTPSQMKKMTTVFQDGAPSRPQGFHYYNIPSFFETVFSVFKVFLKEKFLKRIHFHSNFESLTKYVPKSILPKDIGGDGPSCQELTDELDKNLVSFHSWLQEDAKYGCDESKRPGKPKTSDDLFGLEGSFRPLTID